MVYYKDQNYSVLKKECLLKNALFEDPTFPAEDKSCFPDGDSIKNIEWKRPKDLSSNPHLFIEGLNQNDVRQGQLGNCWFVAACSALASNKDLWKEVIPDGKAQEWDEKEPEKYCGIFHFRFWRFGRWFDIVIDDRLPTKNGKLIFAYSQSTDEFWSALLEKAYAKVNGSYKALDGGDLSEALEDFTGGCTETIELQKGDYLSSEENMNGLYKMLKKACDSKALMAAAIPAGESSEMEQSLPSGLVMGHAYGITGVKSISKGEGGFFSFLKNKDEIHLIRLRNPWGQVEWNGAFSDGSPEWEEISKSNREKLNLNFENDGEFWMKLDDLCANFVNLSVCRVMNTSVFSFSKTWDMSAFIGGWHKPSKAGGCPNNKDSFLMNPQYRFDVHEPGEILVSIMQPPSKTERNYIGISLYRLERNRKYKIHRSPEFVVSSPFKNARGITLRYEVKLAGRYLVLPATFDPNMEGKFLVRFYTSKDHHSREILLEKPKPKFFLLRPFYPAPNYVTRVQIMSASGLNDGKRTTDSYCIVSSTCRQKSYTHIVKDTACPEWKESFIFYRGRLSDEILVRVYDNGLGIDKFLGQCHLEDIRDQPSKDGKVTVRSVNLVGNKKDMKVTGSLKVIVEVSESMTVF